MERKHEKNNNNSLIKKHSITDTCKPLLKKSRLFIQKTEQTNIECSNKCKS